VFLGGKTPSNRRRKRATHFGSEPTRDPCLRPPSVLLRLHRAESGPLEGDSRSCARVLRRGCWRPEILRCVTSLLPATQTHEWVSYLDWLVGDSLNSDRTGRPRPPCPHVQPRRRVPLSVQDPILDMYITLQTRHGLRKLGDDDCRGGNTGSSFPAISVPSPQPPSILRSVPCRPVPARARHAAVSGSVGRSVTPVVFFREDIHPSGRCWTATRVRTRPPGRAIDRRLDRRECACV